MGPTLARILTEGRRAYAALEVDPPTLEAALAAAFRARFETLGIAEDSAEAEALLSKVDAAGLYLAQACEAGVGAAWEELARSFTSRLIGLAIRRGVAPSEAAQFADEVVGDLALPPPRGRTQTRLGTYLGACSLFGWLATILVRRMADRARRKRPASLDGDPSIAEAAPAPRADKPLSTAVARESAASAGDAFTEAWSTLTVRERLAVTLKFRDGLTQRAAARILDVGEPRVSRLVGQALAKLKEPLREAVGTIDEGQWPALRDEIRKRLTTLSAELRPTAEPDERHNTGASA